MIHTCTIVIHSNLIFEHNFWEVELHYITLTSKYKRVKWDNSVVNETSSNYVRNCFPCCKLIYDLFNN